MFTSDAVLHYFYEIYWQSTLLFAGLFIVQRFLRASSASFRRGVWLIAILVMPLLPLSTGLLSYFNVDNQPVITLDANHKPTVAATGKATRAIANGLTAKTQSSSEVTVNEERGNNSVSDTAQEFSWNSTMILVYLTGVMLLLGKIVLNLKELAVVKWNAQKLSEAEMGCLSEVDNRNILKSSRLAIPCAVGVFNFRVIIPEVMFSQYSSRELCAVVRHEASHCRQKDPLFYIVFELYKAVFYLNPLLYMAVDRFKQFSEIIADESAANYLNDSVRYSELLLSLAQRFKRSSAVRVGATGKKSIFVKRIETLLKGDKTMKNSFTKSISLTTVLMIVLFSMVACFPIAEKQNNKEVLSSITTDLKDYPDLLKMFSKEIIAKIDYSDEELEGKFNEEFVMEYKADIRPRIQKFWQFIPESSKIAADLDGDGNNEVIIWSEGLNFDIWGCGNFIAVFKQSGTVWQMSQFKRIEPTVAAHFDYTKFGTRFAFSWKKAADVDGDGNPEILLHYTSINNTGSTSYLELVSSRGVEQLSSQKPLFYENGEFIAVKIAKSARFTEASYSWSNTNGFVLNDKKTVSEKELSVPDYEEVYISSQKQKFISVDLYLEKLDEIDLNMANYKSFQDYHEKTALAISRLIGKIKTPGELKTLFWRSDAILKAKPETPQDQLQWIDPHSETMHYIMYKLAGRQTPEAAKVLVELYADPKARWDAGGSLIAMDALVRAGKITLPYLKRNMKKAPTRIDEKLIELIEGGARRGL